jgi:hypothetical protein
METIHPIQYSNFVEEKLINQSFWYISNIPEVMIFESNKDSFIYNSLYLLFFPIFSETPLEFKMKYEKCSIYLINHSKNKENISLPYYKTPKIIYFVNNSNAKLVINNTSIDLSDKKGKSFFLNENDEINLFRSNNIQTCVALLELKNIKNKTIKQLNYS